LKQCEMTMVHFTNTVWP